MHNPIAGQMHTHYWDTMLMGGEIAFQDILAPAIATLAKDDQEYFALGARVATSRTSLISSRPVSRSRKSQPPFVNKEGNIMRTATQLVIFLTPANEEQALYLIGESLTETAFTSVGTQEEQISWGDLFRLSRTEKRITLALAAPVTPGQIDDIAYLVKTGLILGFVVRGEIDLGERVINNLG